MTPPRSSRVIVRFTDPGIEADPAFAAVSVALAPRAGAGLLAGFNAIGRGDLAGAVQYAGTLAGQWRAGGVGVVHLELAGYDAPALRDSVIAGLSDVITSIGMSHSSTRTWLPPPLRWPGRCVISPLHSASNGSACMPTPGRSPPRAAMPIRSARR